MRWVNFFFIFLVGKSWVSPMEYTKVFGVINSDGDVMPLFLSLQFLRFNMETYIKSPDDQ